MTSCAASTAAPVVILGGHYPSRRAIGTDIYQLPASALFGGLGLGSSIYRPNWPSSSYAVKVSRTNPKYPEQSDRSHNMLMVLSELNSRANPAYIHANICPTCVMDARISGNGPLVKCLVTPWCANGNILECVNRKSTSISSKLTWLTQIAKALSYIHSYDVGHGNLYPGNVLITDNGQAVLADIGVYTLTTQMLLYPSGCVPVLPSGVYKSPGELDPPTDDIVQPSKANDVYAFATTAYAVFAGDPPFSHFRIPAKAIWAIISHGHQSLEKPTDIPDVLWNVLNMCWQRDPVIRPEMSYVVGELQKLGL